MAEYNSVIHQEITKMRKEKDVSKSSNPDSGLFLSVFVMTLLFFFLLS